MDLKKKMKKFFTLTRKSEGFTLVELIVVIAILAILAGVAVPSYSGYIEKANEAADQQQLAALNTAFASACAVNGEDHYKQSPTATILSDGSVDLTVANGDIETAFKSFYEDGKFKYFDTLGYDQTKGIFLGNTLSNLINMMKDAWNAANFGAAGEDAMKMVSAALNQIGEYFSGNNAAFPNGFSIDGLIADMPEDVRNAFGFGSYDVSPEQQEALLEQYVEGYKDMTDEEKAAWKEKTENQKTMNTLKGNAYVTNIANAANSGVTADGIHTDITELLGALNDPSKIDQKKFTELLDQCEGYEVYGLEPEMLAAVGASGVKNDSGISTLGSMYALAAGYLNSTEYKTSLESGAAEIADNKKDVSNFSNVIEIFKHTGFATYLGGEDENGNITGSAVKDIEAYLSYMKYASANGVEMNNAEAFNNLGNAAWEAINGSTGN